VGREAKLGYLGHLLTENRHGFIIDTAVTAASGTAERDAAITMLGELPLTTRRLTVAGDKAYDTRAWVAAVRRMRITPHVAQNEFVYGGSAIDARTTRHVGYRLSHRKRKLVEQAFGWLRPWPSSANCVTAADVSSIGCLASAPPHTTWCAGGSRRAARPKDRGERGI
jgi:Transposase DDE domain